MAYDDLPIEQTIEQPQPETPTSIIMETRNAVNYLGQVVCQVSLPENSPEEHWIHALYPYAIRPPSIDEIVLLKIQAAIKFGDAMIVQAASENVLQGISQAGKTKEVSDYLRSIARYLREGSLYAAIDEFNRLIAEGIPEEIQPFVTESKLNGAKNRVQTYLGLTLT